MNKVLLVHLFEECKEFAPTHWWRLQHCANEKLIVDDQICRPNGEIVGFAVCVDVDEYLPVDSTNWPYKTIQSVKVHFRDRNYFAAIDGLTCRNEETPIDSQATHDPNAKQMSIGILKAEAAAKQMLIDILKAEATDRLNGAQ